MDTSEVDKLYTIIYGDPCEDKESKSVQDRYKQRRSGVYSVLTVQDMGQLHESEQDTIKCKESI